MPGLVTKETDRSVQAFIENVDNKSKREDCFKILEIIEESTGYKAKVWGNEKTPDFIIGFGKYKYQRKGSQEEFEWFRYGFAPRKSKLTIYLPIDVGKEKEILEKLGKCKWGKGCLYIHKLADVDLEVLKMLIRKNNVNN